MGIDLGKGYQYQCQILISACHSFNAVEWKSTLFGVILGTTSFRVESTPNYC